MTWNEIHRTAARQFLRHSAIWGSITSCRRQVPNGGPLWEALARQKVGNKAGPVYLSCWHETLAVNLAWGYTTVTGRPQAVVLHAGAGLLQGSMAIHAANASGLPAASAASRA